MYVYYNILVELDWSNKSTPGTTEEPLSAVLCMHAYTYYAHAGWLCRESSHKAEVQEGI